MALSGQFQLAPFLLSQSHTSNSIFSILIDSMLEVSLADIMINKQKGFIVGCGGHGHGRTADFATPAARKSIFGIFVGHLG